MAGNAEDGTFPIGIKPYEGLAWSIGWIQAKALNDWRQWGSSRNSKAIGASGRRELPEDKFAEKIASLRPAHPAVTAEVALTSRAQTELADSIHVTLPEAS